ncbi:MAG: recombinase family protein, partial [Eubacteriaceae bacterium]
RVSEWSNTIILKMLRNEKYVGDLCQKKTYTPDYLSHAKKYNRGNEEMVYLNNHHEAIIDREIWDATQAELARRSPSNEQKSKHSNRYWCSGKLMCGECGQRFVSRTKKLKNGETYKAWRCYAAANHGVKKTDNWDNTIGCDSASINDKVVLESVKRVVLEIQAKKDKIIKDMLQEIKTVKKLDVKVDTAPLYSKIEALNDKKRRAIDLVLDGTISKADLKEQTKFYDNEIELITEQIASAKDTNNLYQQQIQGIEEYITEINRIMDFDTESTLLYREIVDHIVISNGNLITVYLKCVPFGVRLHYESHGKMDRFRIDFDEIQVMN